MSWAYRSIKLSIFINDFLHIWFPNHAFFIANFLRFCLDWFHDRLFVRLIFWQFKLQSAFGGLWIKLLRFLSTHFRILGHERWLFPKSQSEFVSTGFLFSWIFKADFFFILSFPIFIRLHPFFSGSLKRCSPQCSPDDKFAP